MNPVQHYWLRVAKDDFAMMQRIYDNLQEQMQYFARLHAELSADIDQCLVNLNSRLLQNGPLEYPQSTETDLVKNVSQNRLKIIRIEYTTLDDCVKACRHQQELTENTTKSRTWPFDEMMLFAVPVIFIGYLHITYDSWTIDESENEDSDDEDRSMTQWTASFRCKYKEKVSISKGHVQVTSLNESNSGKKLTVPERHRVSRQWREQNWPSNGYLRVLYDFSNLNALPSALQRKEVSHIMVYSEPTLDLIVDLVHRLYDMELLPENTSC